MQAAICFSQDVTAIIIHSAAIAVPAYVAHFLRSRKDSLLQKNQGSTIAGITRDSLALEQIPLPPISEQQHIVEILREAEAIRRLRVQSESKLIELFSSLFGYIIENLSEEVIWTRIGDIIRVKSGEFLSASLMKDGQYPVYGGNGITGFHNAFMFDVPTICVGRVGAYCGAIHLTERNSWITDNALYVSEKLTELDDHYIAHALRAAHLNQYASQGGQPLISAGRIYPVRIPLLPIQEQQQFSKLMTEIEVLQRDQLQLIQTESALEYSLSARTFSGELTAGWRETHADKLALEARERDAALKQAGATISRSRRATIQELDLIFEQRTDGIHSDLNREQRDLLSRIQQRFDGVPYARYFTAQSLSGSLDDPLHRNPQAIEGHLAVFAVRGLIIPVSREEQPEGTSEFVFGNAYRLPLRDREVRLDAASGLPMSPDDGGEFIPEPISGDGARLRELERLASRLENERAIA